MRGLEEQSERYAKMQWVLAGILCVLGAAFYLGLYRPTMRRLADLHLQIDAKQRRLDADQLQAAKLPEVAYSVANLRSKLETFDKKLPVRDEVGQFVHDITQVKQQTGLRKLDVTPSVKRRTETFGEWPILLHFEGDFASAAAFLRQTEQMPRLTRVRSLKMGSVDGKLGTVEVDATVNIYYMKG